MVLATAFSCVEPGCPQEASAEGAEWGSQRRTPSPRLRSARSEPCPRGVSFFSGSDKRGGRLGGGGWCRAVGGTGRRWRCASGAAFSLVVDSASSCRVCASVARCQRGYLHACLACLPVCAPAQHAVARHSPVCFCTGCGGLWTRRAEHRSAGVLTRTHTDNAHTPHTSHPLYTRPAGGFR